METEIKTTEIGKDKILEKLERMLENASENVKQPILDLINKRKVELGLLSSDLPPAGYKLKKTEKDAKSKSETKDIKESLRKIAVAVGRVPETGQTIPRDLDIKDQPLKKDKKTIEEADSYKY